jgi:hypothetical protein
MNAARQRETQRDVLEPNGAGVSTCNLELRGLTARTCIEAATLFEQRVHDDIADDAGRPEVSSFNCVLQRGRGGNANPAASLGNGFGGYNAADITLAGHKHTRWLLVFVRLPLRAWRRGTLLVDVTLYTQLRPASGAWGLFEQLRTFG